MARAEKQATNPAGERDKPDLVTELENGSTILTPAGHDFLGPLVTNTDRAVYAIMDELGQMPAAGAMARLSRRGDDLRTILAAEFSDPAERRDQDLLARIISVYGDDSVQQLISVHVVVEGGSQILTKDIEHGRLAAYLEQSTRYIFYDQKDQHGRYRYLVPTELEGSSRQDYDQIIDQIFDIYSELVRDLVSQLQARSTVPESDRDLAWRLAIRAQACDAARGLLPVATKSTVGVFASGQALESLVMRLLGAETEEARIAGRQILDESRKVAGVFLERADRPDRGGAITAYQVETRGKLKQLAARLQADCDPSLLESSREQQAWAELVDHHPANELELLPDMLYESTNQSLGVLRRIVETLNPDQQREIFQTYVGERLNRRQKPGRALEKAVYSWDIVCDYGIFRDLQRHRIVNDLGRQYLTTDYGYGVPSLVSDCGYDDKYRRAFDLAEGLYQRLKGEAGPAVAQYATLLGHQMRWKLTYNAREAFHIHELRTTPQGHPNYRALVNQMHLAVSQVHPLIANAMRFVNKGEDLELTRLGAERASQKKLQQLLEQQRAG